MKTLKFYFTTTLFNLLIVFFLTYPAYSDVTTTRRNSCNVFKKYKTFNRIRTCGNGLNRTIGKVEDKGCTWAESWVEVPFCGIGPVKTGQATPYTASSSGVFSAIVAFNFARVSGSGRTSRIITGNGTWKTSNNGECFGPISMGVSFQHKVD